jgi:hypothetical protein
MSWNRNDFENAAGMNGLDVNVERINEGNEPSFTDLSFENTCHL